MLDYYKKASSLAVSRLLTNSTNALRPAPYLETLIIDIPIIAEYHRWKTR